MLTSNKCWLSLSIGRSVVSECHATLDIFEPSLEELPLKRKLHKDDGVEEHSKPAWSCEANQTTLS